MNDNIGQNNCSIPCNLCGSTDIHEVCLKDRHGGFLRTVICVKCGLIWSDPRPGDDEIRDFYSKEYRKEYKLQFQPKLKHVYRDAKEALRRYDFLKETINRDHQIADVGSGSGVFVYFLRSLGFNAIGIEPDEGYSNYSVKELGVPVTNTFVQDMDDVESFDIITLHHVLEHLTDPLGMLKKVHSLLKKNGHFMVEVPNSEDMQQDPKNRYHKAHIYTFNPETLLCMGSKAGLKPVKQRIAPLNGNMTVIFQKGVDYPEISGELPGNFKKVTHILEEHTNLRHFTTPVPYKKFILNGITAIKEKIAVRGFSSGQDIIDDLISKHPVIF